MARRSAGAFNDTRSGVDGIEEKVVVITAGLPHGEPEQVMVDDEFTLGSERLRVIVGNHQLLILVVKEGLRERGMVRNQMRPDLEWATLTV